MVTLSIAFDHRVADGATAARFTAAVRDRLEQPTRYL
jgi:pyruvate/2-oxoglutarate dehydrogenase complex dihydrolipoamide acyltransferase (E2) component